MDVELTPERADRLAEAGYVLAPALGTPPVRGRIRVRNSAGTLFDLELASLPDGTRDQCIAHLSGWFSVADPGVEHLVDALDLDDTIGYVTAVAAPCTLETFVQTTGRLGAGHTSTVLVTLGRTLARLHARGLRYGPIHPRDVLVDAGRVLLTVPRPTLTSATPMAPSPQEDAYHLAALADSVLAPSHGPQATAQPEPGLRGLARLVVSAMGDADNRPGVGTLATLSHDLAPCLPLEPPVSLDPAAPVGQDAAARADVPGEGGADSRGSGTRAGSEGRRGSLNRPPSRRTAFRGSAPQRGVERGAAQVRGRTEMPSPSERSSRSADGRLPLRGVRASGIPTGPEHDRRRPKGTTVTLVVIVLAVLGVGAGLVHRAGGDAPAQAASVVVPTGATGSGVTTVAQPDAEDPGAAAARLTRARMDRVVALTNADPVGGTDPDATQPEDGGGSAWADVMVAGSPAYVQATELVASLRASGARISGLTVETRDAMVLSQVPATEQAPPSAQVQVAFTVGAYTLETAAGTQSVPAAEPRTAVLELIATESGWLVASVNELPPVG